MDTVQPPPATHPDPVPPPVRDNGPIPMSFPAILRNPGLADRFAHLRIKAQAAMSPSVSLPVKRNRRDDKEGKRWVRRKENARFVGNAHIVAPSNKDFDVPAPSGRPTFPEPLPNFLSRNNPVPPAIPVVREPTSANAGRFSLSLKGMRRQLRSSGPRTELLVKEVEGEIVAWLAAGGVMLAPDASAMVDSPGALIGSTGAILEVSRTPLQLVWNIEDNAFTRYVVHCCARYHDVVSFSKDTSGQRLTYLLRPNVTRPTRYAAPTLDTPPVTDLSELSATDLSASESEPPSDRELSDAGADSPTSPSPSPAAAALTAIAETETSAPASPALRPAVYAYASRGPQISMAALDSDGWSVIGESDVEADGDGDMSAPEGDLAASVASLSLHDDAQADVEVDPCRRSELELETERTPLADRRRQGPDVLRSRLLERQRRAASSPSRSPARRMPPRARQRVEHAVRAKVVTSGRRSFHDYLFA